MRKLHSEPLFFAFIIGFFSFLLFSILKFNIEIEENKKKLSFLKALNGVFDNDDEIEIIDDEQ